MASYIRVPCVICDLWQSLGRIVTRIQKRTDRLPTQSTRLGRFRSLGLSPASESEIVGLISRSPSCFSPAKASPQSSCIKREPRSVLSPSVAAKSARAGSPGAATFFSPARSTAPSCNLRPAVIAAAKQGRLGGLLPFVLVKQCAKSTRLARALKPIQQERHEAVVLKWILCRLLRIVAFV
jgi:hypothetical protein